MPTPPIVEEIVCGMRHASEDPHGWRLRAMIVMLWRGGLRVQEALALSERDLDPSRGSVLVGHGKRLAQGWPQAPRRRRCRLGDAPKAA
jgi:site-specific recombinase XerD